MIDRLAHVRGKARIIKISPKLNGHFIRITSFALLCTTAKRVVSLAIRCFSSFREIDSRDIRVLRKFEFDLINEIWMSGIKPWLFLSQKKNCSVHNSSLGKTEERWHPNFLTKHPIWHVVRFLSFCYLYKNLNRYLITEDTVNKCNSRRVYLIAIFSRFQSNSGWNTYVLKEICNFFLAVSLTRNTQAYHTCSGLLYMKIWRFV